MILNYQNQKHNQNDTHSNHRGDRDNRFWPHMYIDQNPIIDQIDADKQCEGIR